ncbi:hypothetical protein O6H91_10G019400 [Diphasiastrum complanatum]|uniref:Uncharacterized protein n=1 Tax=Diphasiastrum complanatum TaxID=34168 RepID=A0ACC2CF52_DIPCM|nr:hypothetical protein O6H91_10G019400 [Diphasiastrum complanatum]
MAALVGSACAGCLKLNDNFPVVAGRLKPSFSFPGASLPAVRPARFVCSAEQKPDTQDSVPSLAALTTAVTTLAAGHPAIALVDDRLSGEGTGLSLGLSNPLLLWILLGVSALIWSLYFSFSSTLPEGDDDSGLSL